MKSKKPFAELRNNWEHLSESLLGAPDELTTDHALETLRSAGVNPRDMKDRFYKALRDRAQEYWMRQETLPPGLKKALDDLRPASYPARSEQELLQQAEARLENLLENMQVPLVYQQPLEIHASYRNKSGVTDKDKIVLDRLKESLNARIDRKRKND